MNILLYNPDNGVTRNFMPHLWMFLLQALTPPQHKVHLIDGNAQPLSEADLKDFIARHGMPGYAPTQGHIASAVCYTPHACRAMAEGRMKRVLFMAKGSLFLGRMTEMADGLSFILEA